MITIAPKLGPDMQLSKQYHGHAGHAVLINNTAHSYHWGCYATSMALYSSLIEVGYAVSTFPVETTHRLSNTPKTADELASDSFFTAFRARYPHLDQAFRTADIVVVNGEGTLHRNHDASRNLLNLIWLAGERYEAQVHLVNHSCFPSGSSVPAEDNIQNLYKFALSPCHRIVTRERLSTKIYASLGLETIDGFDSLPVFADKYLPRESGTKVAILIGGGVSLSGDEAQKLINTLSRSLPQDAPVAFLAGASHVEPPEDAYFFELLQASVGHVDLWRPESIEGWLNMIADARLFITGRFHHLVAATAFGTPIIPITSNTPKSEGVCDLLGFSAPCNPAHSKFTDRLSARIVEGIDGRADKTTPEDQQKIIKLGHQNLDWVIR